MSGSATTSPSPAASERAPFWLRLLVAACRCLLAMVLLMAATGKLLRPGAFIDRLALQGVPWAEWVGVFVPWLEATCGLCLVLGAMRREAAVLACGLLVSFSVFVVLQPAQSDCECFLVPGLARGAWASLPVVLARNAGLLLVGIGASLRAGTVRG
jgi:uncharacterized membrane protein YphA (DoxX/SURF4 family)